MGKAEPLAMVIADTAAALSAPALRTLVDHLRNGSAPDAISDAIPTTSYRTAVERLLKVGSQGGPMDGASIALALESVVASRREAPRLSLVWTGPTTDAVSVRRTDQALLQLINRATSRVIVVSFAVYKVPNIAATLEKAARRGVVVDLVVETEEASGGKIAFDGWQKLGRDVHTTYRLWTWAHDRRPVTPSGKLATLHAKCAVADGDRLLVSSANLTEFALNFNMELGLLLSGGEVPSNVAKHFETLMVNGDLVAILGP